MTRLSRRDRRALRLGAAILVPALLAALLAGPVRHRMDEAKGLVAAESLLYQRERALAASATSMTEALDVARSAREMLRARLFRGNAPVAAQELASYVAGQARLSAVLLRANQAGGTEALSSGIVAYRVEIAGVADIEGIADILARLETGERLVHVERLVLERQEGPGLNGGEGVQLIGIEATLAGYGEAATPPDGERDG